MLDKTFGNRHDAALLGAHQVNAASRRVGFAAQLDVGGTSLQAKAAVNALGREVGPAGWRVFNSWNRKGHGLVSGLSSHGQLFQAGVRDIRYKRYLLLVIEYFLFAIGRGAHK